MAARAGARGAADARLGSVLRVGVWVLHLSLPLIGLWLLVARPNLDVVWENRAWHFWLVAGVAAVNVYLGARVSEASRRRSDARLFLVSLAFTGSAGFLLLHALATPGVLLPHANAGFVVATPVGLVLAAALVAASSIEFGPRGAAAVMRHQRTLRLGLAALLAAWALVSLLDLPPLRQPLPGEEAKGWLFGLTVAGVPLYAIAALRYYALHRRRPAVMLVGVITAFALLAEAMVAIAVARSWQASWWEWHVLMAVAFAFVAYSAQVEYAREDSRDTALFRSISLEETLREIREEYASALEALVSAMQRSDGAGRGQPVAALAARLADRFGLSRGQGDVLASGAEALLHEREQIARLGALVAVGREANVIVDERTLLRRALDHASRGFPGDALRLALVEEGTLRFPEDLRAGTSGDDVRAGTSDGPPVHGPAGSGGHPEAVRAVETLEPVEAGDDAPVLALPLTVKGRAAGVLEVRRERGAFAERDRSLLASLASQLSIALENARLYRQLDALFRSYMSPDVATALLADPEQAELGGAVREVTALFADLRGFTSFSERSEPELVVEVLNRYFGAAVPIVLEQGGTVTQFVGDALMALFNAPTRQPDHALRAARAALGMQRAVDGIAAGRAGWPRFRVGINTGPAVVGNIGSVEFRNFTAIGDAINLASRLETSAEEGQVVVGPTTFALIRDVAVVRPLGPLQVKGKATAVEAYVLTGLREPGGRDGSSSAAPAGGPPPP